MKAFYDYGRMHWRWTTSSPAAAGQGGLVLGRAANCACATYNDNLKFLAERIGGVAGIARADLNEHFITVPGGVCIDSSWTGNVRTTTLGYTQFKCFKFATHYWLTLAGANYDACFNNVFADRENIIFTRLQLVPPPISARFGLNQSTIRQLAKPLPYAKYIVEVQAGGLNPNGWPGWQVVSEAELAVLRR